MVAVFGSGALTVAPDIDLVDDVVVEQGGQMDQLDRAGQLQQRLVKIVDRPSRRNLGGENHQGRPQPLAAVLEALQGYSGLADGAFLQHFEHYVVASVDRVLQGGIFFQCFDHLE